MTRKRLGKAERKRQIKNAAIKLFTEKGYRNTSVQDIVDAAEFSKGGFYNYYDSKKMLLSEILGDGYEFRNNAILLHKHQSENLNRKEFLIEALLDKIIDDNIYKKLYSTLAIEMVNNPDLIELYEQTYNKFTQSFISFCQQNDLAEYIKITNYEFGSFITSLMIGLDIIQKINKTNYRNMLREILTAYFDKIDLFND